MLSSMQYFFIQISLCTTLFRYPRYLKNTCIGSCFEHPIKSQQLNVQHTLGNLFLGYSTETVNTTLYQVIPTINNGIRKDLNGRVAHSTHLVYCKSRIDLFIILVLQHRQHKLSGLYVSGLVIQLSPKFIGGAAE